MQGFSSLVHLVRIGVSKKSPAAAGEKVVQRGQMTSCCNTDRRGFTRLSKRDHCIQYNQVGLKRGRSKGNGKTCPKWHKTYKQPLLSFRFANIPRISFKTQMKSLSLSIQPQMLLSLNSSRNHCAIMAAKDIAWCLAKRSTHHHAHLKAAIGTMFEKGKGKSKDMTSSRQRK